MKKSIACIVALFAFGIANAAAEEMAVPPSQFITSSRVPYLAWTGFYVGINGGFAWSNSSVAFAANDPAALAGTCGGGGAPGPRGQCITSVDFRRDGVVAGLAPQVRKYAGRDGVIHFRERRVVSRRVAIHSVHRLDTRHSRRHDVSGNWTSIRCPWSFLE